MTDAIHIDKHIPPPATRQRSSYARALETMQAGDSFFLPYPASIGAIEQAAAARGIRITRRKVAGGYRVWKL